MSHKLSDISEDYLRNLLGKIREVRKLIAGYIEYLKKSKQGHNDPGNQTIVREEMEIYNSADGSFIDPQL